jgi:hypothetical protein
LEYIYNQRGTQTAAEKAVSALEVFVTFGQTASISHQFMVLGDQMHNIGAGSSSRMHL